MNTELSTPLISSTTRYETPPTYYKTPSIKEGQRKWRQRVDLTSTAHLRSISRPYSLLTDRKSRARVSTIGSPVYGSLMVRE